MLGIPSLGLSLQFLHVPASNVVLEVSVPGEVPQVGLFGDHGLDAGGKVDGRLFRFPELRLQPPDIHGHHPPRHQIKAVLCEGLLSGVPIGIQESLVVPKKGGGDLLDGHGTDQTIQVKGPLVELHGVLIVDASALGKDDQGWLGCVAVANHMLTHLIQHALSVPLLVSAETEAAVQAEQLFL